MGGVIQDLVNAIAKSLSFTTDGLIASLKFGQSLYNNLKPFLAWFASLALILAIIYFIIEMDRLILLNGNVGMKELAAPLFKFGFAMVIILNGNWVMSMVLDFWNGSLNWMETYLAGGHTDVITGNYTFNGGGFFTLVALLIPMLLMWLASLIVSLIWRFKGIVFKFKFLFRVMFLPIACADIYNLHNSTTIRYIKGTLALGVAVVGFIALPTVGGWVFADMLGASWNAASGSGSGWEVLEAMLDFILVPIAELAAVNVIEQFAKEALQ